MDFDRIRLAECICVRIAYTQGHKLFFSAANSSDPSLESRLKKKKKWVIPTGANDSTDVFFFFKTTPFVVYSFFFLLFPLLLRVQTYEHTSRRVEKYIFSLPEITTVFFFFSNR